MKKFRIILTSLLVLGVVVCTFAFNNAKFNNRYCVSIEEATTVPTGACPLYNDLTRNDITGIPFYAELIPDNVPEGEEEEFCEVHAPCPIVKVLTQVP